MLLLGVKESHEPNAPAWLYSRWQMTRPTGWEGILAAAEALWEGLGSPEIFLDDEPAAVGEGNTIPQLPEAGKLMIRGLSSSPRLPIRIAFYNQTDLVDADLPLSEGVSADYESFNRFLCLFMDSVELSMNR